LSEWPVKLACSEHELENAVIILPFKPAPPSLNDPTKVQLALLFSHEHLDTNLWIHGLAV
jgi:hypothetical protein